MNYNELRIYDGEQALISIIPELIDIVLDKRQAEILTMRLQGKKQQEIAKELSITQSCVSVSLARSKEKLYPIISLIRKAIRHDIRLRTSQKQLAEFLKKEYNSVR